MTPEQATFLCAVELRTFERESGTTLRMLEAVPVDKADYRPDTISKSAFDLAWHIAAAENMFLTAVAEGKFTFGVPRPESIRTAADIASWYAQRSQENAARISKLSPEELTRKVDFRGVFEAPAVTFIGLALRHTAHHRGQLSLYLRPMGAKVPAIYGESYDTAQARQSAQA
jgi:uncharacterized damage-inducible protein DinB